MSAGFVKTKIGTHVQNCSDCLGIYCTLSRASKKSLLLLYKKKCYELVSEKIDSPLFALRIKEISDKIEQICLLEETNKCEQIAAHSLFRKR